MSKIGAALQDLLVRTRAKRLAHGLLFRIQSGDGWIGFRGSAGTATPDSVIKPAPTMRQSFNYPVAPLDHDAVGW